MERERWESRREGRSGEGFRQEVSKQGREGGEVGDGKRKIWGGFKTFFDALRLSRFLC